MKYSKEETSEARKYLLSILKPGDTIYTKINHVSRSGMSRSITMFALRDNQPIYLTGYANRLLGEKRDAYDGTRVDGCGMDMGFNLVYCLSWKLFPNGFAPSSIAIRPTDEKRVNVNVRRGKDTGLLTKDEVAKLYAKGWRFIDGRNGDTSGWESDGGYALQQRAL